MENCAAISQMKFIDITHCHVSDMLQLYILQYVASVSLHIVSNVHLLVYSCLRTNCYY